MTSRAIMTCLAIVAGFLFSTSAPADQSITLEARLAHPVMKDGETQRNFLRIGLGGCKPEPTQHRTPVNVAFVIDRSGSMQGARIAQAREAAIMAVNRLDANDIASVVIFDNVVDVLIPARKVDDRGYFIDRIGQIGTRGTTAIFDGVNAGAREVRTFKDSRRLNRVVLLSDGQANVGPRRPEDFAGLGRDLLAEGISVSTIGLGLSYNEDLMLQLARASDGNHAFAADASDLIKIFNREFDDVLASCAQTVSIDVELRPGIRAVRALSRDGGIQSQHTQFLLNQVYAATEHYVLLEIETDGKPAADVEDLGRVRVAYTVPQTGAYETIMAAIRGRFSPSADEVSASRDETVLESVVEQTTRERARLAVGLRDQGKGEEARTLFQQNVADIQAYLMKARPSARLDDLKKQYESIANTAVLASPSQWNLQRKELRTFDARAAGAPVRY
jgi:Ca-activated chloride channel family protein